MEGTSVASIKQLSQDVPFVFLSQVPDKASSNCRALGFIHGLLRDSESALENPMGCCAVHQ
eukprot:8859071-Pyramimonas_sp.AAC.1